MSFSFVEITKSFYSRVEIITTAKNFCSAL